MIKHRKKLMEEYPISELEKMFYSNLPWITDNEDDSMSDDMSSHKTKYEDDCWTNKLLQFGLMYFVDSNQKLELLKGLKNCTSSVEYQFPENIADYIVYSNRSPTKDELATDYVLKRTEFGNTEDMINYAECSKNDLVKLNKLNSVRKMLWNLLFKKNKHIRETSDNLDLVANKEIEFRKQVDTLKSFLDEQTKNMSNFNKNEYYYYLKLLNDRYFYMNNLRSIFNKIKVSVLLIYQRNSR